jgi:hypothetical protein
MNYKIYPLPWVETQGNGVTIDERNKLNTV